MGILQRYVLRELLIDFSYTLSVITSIFFIALAAQLLYTFHEFNVLSILGLFPLLVPTSLAYTVPVSMMIATVLTFGRLTAEREILAMRTSGVHIGRVVTPALLLGLVLAIGAFYVNSVVIPYCHRMQTKVKQDAFSKFLASFDRGVKLTSFDRFQLAWTRRDESGRMQGIAFMRLSEKGAREESLLADSGRLWIDTDTNRLHLELRDVDWAIDRERGAGSDSPAAPAAKEAPPKKGDRSAAGAPAKPRATSSPEVPPAAPALDAEIEGVSKIRSAAPNPLRPRESGLVSTRFASLSLSYGLDELFEPDRKAPKIRERPTHSLREEFAAATPARRAELGTEIHRRSANSFACFAFALIGAPLGILVRKGNRLVAFFVSFLVISLVYYPLSMAGEALGSVGRFPAAISVWWANGALVALGAVLLRSVFRR